MIRIISIIAVIIILIPEAISQTCLYEKALNQVQCLQEEGDISRAKNLVSELMDSYPDKWFELSKKMISLNNESALYQENLAIFSDAHKRGYFYFIHPRMSEYKPYLNLPGFDSLSLLDLAMRDEANKKSETTFRVQLPERYDKEKRYPVIYIFHGGGRSAEKAQEHWQVAVLNKNFIKVYLQSYRHFDSETYGWGSGDERLDRDITRIFREIAGQYKVDTGFVLTGGISAGATAAIDISLRGIIPVKGFIAWCPDQPSFIRNNNLSELAVRSVRGYISAGENDYFRPGQELMIRRLDSLGIQTRYEIETGSGHNYPANENISVNKALKFIIDMEKPAGVDIEPKIDDAIKSSLCRGISIATGDEGMTLFYNYGTAFRDSIALPDQTTIFETGSLSKLITVFIYCKLLDEKILDGNDMIGKYLPGLENQAIRGIRLDQLVTHTSGLPSMPDNLKREENGNPAAGYSEDDLLSFLNSYNLDNNSTTFTYSNTGTALLGLILECATGEKYSDLLHRYVTGRYNMNHTHIRVPDSQQTQFADGSSQGADIEHWDIFNFFAPTGGIRSSSEDLAVFLDEYLFNDENIKIRQRMEKIRIEDAGEGIHVASGWFVKVEEGERIYYSFGSTGGFSAFMGFTSNSRRYTVILSNSNIGLNETGWKLLSSPAAARER